mgnify:CR=1 FL=1
MGIKKKLKEKLTEEMESRFHMEDKYDEVIKNVKFADSPTEEEPTINADNKIIEDEDDDYEPFDAIAAIKKNHFIFGKLPFVCACLTVVVAVAIVSMTLVAVGGKLAYYDDEGRVIANSIKTAKNDLEKNYNEKNTALLCSNYLGEKTVINLFSNEESNYYIQIFDSGKTEEFLRFIVSINDKSRVFINNVNGASYITLLNDSSFPVVKGDILYGSVYLNNVLTTKIIYNF